MNEKKFDSLMLYLKKAGFKNLAALLEIKDIRKVLLKDSRTKKERLKDNIIENHAHERK